MKKLNLFAAAAASVLFAACSSDAPENTGVNNNLEDMMYMSLSIRTNATRATEEGTANESAIKNVTLYVYDGAECIYANVTDVFKATDDKDAIFQVPRATFEAITAPTSDHLDLFVVCNAPADVKPFECSLDQVLENVEKASLTTNGEFVMSGYAKADIVDGSDILDKGNTQEDPLRIATDINVDRLVAKFRYSTTEGYGAGVAGSKAAGVNFELKGIELLNENNNVYVYPHYAKEYNTLSTDAANFKAFGNVAQFGGFGFYKAADCENDYEAALLNSYDYKSGAADEYCLPRTNILAKGDAALSDVTYLAYKFAFTAAAGSIAENDLDGNNIVYSYNGWLLGKAANLENLTAFNGMPSSTVNFLRGLYNTAKNKADKDAEHDIDYYLAEYHVDGLYQYAAEDDGTGLGHKEYYCYFVRPIMMTDKEADVQDAVKYMVKRNNLYKINVNSISAMGIPGTETPDVIDPELIQYWIDITIHVNDWEIVDVNNWNFK